MRPMVLEFQEDPVCAFLDRQYMLGSDILVAPVFDETGYVEYYLPAGTWKDVYTDETITLSSGKVFKETRDHLHMPIFVRG